MATVKMIEYENASPEVKVVYDDIMATRNTDTINNFWKTIAVHPPTLARVWRDLKEVMAPGRLDPLTKEMIAVAVSATNGCSYCVNSHTAAAMAKGMDKEMLGELMAVVALFNTTNRLVEGYQVEPDVFPPLD
jgi:AhpD family alkylhydroperoxidase